MKLEKQEAIEFFSALFNGEHHIPKSLKEFGYGWSVDMGNDFSTYDFNLMTKLVVLAHDRCIRATIQGKSKNTVTIGIHKRDRAKAGSMCEFHPELEDAVKSIRYSIANKNL